MKQFSRLTVAVLVVTMGVKVLSIEDLKGYLEQ